MLTRRSFIVAGAGVSAVVPGDIVLEAIYGAKLPATLRLSGRMVSRRRYIELRRYTGSGNLGDVFVRAGLRPLEMGAMRFLFPFDSLRERSEAWDRLNSLPEWARIQASVRLSEMTIFVNSSGRQPGGRIFEMSL